MDFASDNAAGAAPGMIEALVRANESAAPAYGEDAITARLEERFQEIFERDLAVFLVATGTAANALAIAAFTPPWGAVLCHCDSHIVTDECGAPEAFSGGAKLLTLAGAGGKVTRAAAEAVLERWPAGRQHSVQPSVLSLSQATEAGTVYRPDEIRELAGLVRSRGMALHMDGARLANALVFLGVSPAEGTWRAGVDVLSFGATKGGALAAEAVIVFDPARAADMLYRRKRSGHLLSKHRFLAAQMQAYLDGDAWLEWAGHANAMAKRLAEGLPSRGVRLAVQCEANEVFAVLARDRAEALRTAGARFYDWPSEEMRAAAGLREGETIVRLVTSWASRPADIERFLAFLGA